MHNRIIITATLAMRESQHYKNDITFRKTTSHEQELKRKVWKKAK